MLAEHIGIPQLRDLAGRSEEYRESLKISGMNRLAELLYPESRQSDAQLDLSIKFNSGEQGFPEISGHIEGSLDIICQRCLGPLAWEFNIDFGLVLVGDVADLKLVSEPIDAVVVSEHGICMSEIAEDELLAVLPFAPMHATNENCNPSGSVEIVASDTDVSEVVLNKPFGDLAAMLKGAEASGDEN
jgi:uncharacterized protein